MWWKIPRKKRNPNSLISEQETWELPTEHSWQHSIQLIQLSSWELRLSMLKHTRDLLSACRWREPSDYGNWSFTADDAILFLMVAVLTELNKRCHSSSV
jgi:hypothetical protein